MKIGLIIISAFVAAAPAVPKPAYPPSAIIGENVPVERIESLPTVELDSNENSLWATGKSAFTATVQFAVQDTSPVLVKRSQRIVMDEFNTVFTSWPEFGGKPFKMTINGDEVIVFLTAPNDVRETMGNAVAQVIKKIDGRVRARGRSQVYRTSFSQSLGGLLKVVMDKSNVVSISAQSVPMRDILKEIKSQTGDFSYLIPGQCARQLVDWDFGKSEGERVKSKPLDAVMRELGSLFNLKIEKYASTYIFSGVCPEQFAQRRSVLPAAAKLLPDGQVADQQADPFVTRVFFPIVPISPR